VSLRRRFGYKFGPITPFKEAFLASQFFAKKSITHARGSAKRKVKKLARGTAKR
jgi:hypothetical protein